MKKLVLIIGGIAAVIVLVAVIFLSSIGMFSDYKAEIKNMGPYTFVYEKFTGPYHETKKVFDSVYSKLEKAGIKTERGFGIYYDNPSEVESSKLRSECGSLIDEKNKKAFEKVKDKFTYKIIPVSKAIVVVFPIKNAMSYMFGPMKVYPILNSYMKDNNLKVSNPAYELYDMPEKKIYYVMPIK